jgi:hypothetical protein
MRYLQPRSRSTSRFVAWCEGDEGRTHGLRLDLAGNRRAARINGDGRDGIPAGLWRILEQGVPLRYRSSPRTPFGPAPTQLKCRFSLRHRLYGDRRRERDLSAAAFLSLRLQCGCILARPRQCFVSLDQGFKPCGNGKRRRSRPSSQVAIFAFPIAEFFSKVGCFAAQDFQTLTQSPCDHFVSSSQRVAIQRRSAGAAFRTNISPRAWLTRRRTTVLQPGT